MIIIFFSMITFCSTKKQMSEEILSQGRKALEALQEFYRTLDKKMLFPEQDASLNLVVRYKKTQVDRIGSYKKFITLPSSDKNPVNTSLCLILPDLDSSEAAYKNPEVDAQSKRWVDILVNDYGINKTDFAKVLTYTQLTREYSQPVDRNKLAHTYDIFAVDVKLLLKARSFLGKEFKKTSKIPIPIDSSSRQKFIKRLKEAYNIVVLPLEPYMDCFTIRIGHLYQIHLELSSNLSEIIERMMEYCHGGPINIRSCYIQVARSPEHSLPIYVDFGEQNLLMPKTTIIKTGHANEVKFTAVVKPECSEEFDELTTLPDGLAVKVKSDGQVTVVDALTGEEVLYPTAEQDEWEAKDDIKPMSAKVVKKIVKAKAKRVLSGKKLKSAKA